MKQSAQEALSERQELKGEMTASCSVKLRRNAWRDEVYSKETGRKAAREAKRQVKNHIFFQEKYERK